MVAKGRETFCLKPCQPLAELSSQALKRRLIHYGVPSPAWPSQRCGKHLSAYKVAILISEVYTTSLPRANTEGVDRRGQIVQG
jgi:hypothetical protein